MAPDNTAEDDTPQRRAIITLRREYLEAVDTLLPLLRRQLCIFDPDLSQLGLNAPERIEALNELLRRHRDNRIYIAVHSTDYVTRHAPRLLNLLSRFSASMFIHQTQDDAARVPDCFVLCDELHFVRRAVATQPRGALYLHDAQEARLMRDRFEEIWQSAFPAVSAIRTGL